MNKTIKPLKAETGCAAVKTTGFLHRIGFIIVLVFLSYPVPAGCRENPAKEERKVMIWEDEFDYEGFPDESKWSYEEGFIRNGEPQYYTKKRCENAFVKGGVLKITARKEEYNGAAYTSASIHTKGKLSIAKGRIEVKAKLPVGRAVWPAVWTLGTNIGEVGWPMCGEIDIMEYWGRNPGAVHANVHTKDYNHGKGTGRGGHIEVEKPWEDFHVFAVNWYDDRLDFYFDDNLYYTCEKQGEGVGEWPFDEPQYLLLNLALSRSLVADTEFPVEYLIDYVRVYDLE